MFAPTRFAVLLLAALSLAGCMGKAEMVTEGGGVGGKPATTEDEAPVPFRPVPLASRTLLSFQYKNAVADLLGADAASVVNPPADIQINGFSAIAASQLTESTTNLRAYELSAHAAAEKAFADTNPNRDALLGCTPVGVSDTACLTSFTKSFGRLAFRRPLTDDEVALWVPIGQDAATAYSDFYKGPQFIAAGLLQSPNFLYVVESGTQDPEHAGQLKLTGYELASRLSFFLAGTTPSSALLDAAAAGELDTVEGIKAHAAALLQAPTAKQAVAAFFDELLELRGLDKMSKDMNTFPSFSPALATAMRQETQLMIENLVFESNEDFRTLFDADYTYVNRDLAQLYGFADLPASGFERKVLPAGRRGGFFGQSAFLAMQAHPRLSSPTYRGKFVRERLLCQQIPAPPNNVDTTALQKEDPSKPPMTMRDKLMEHRNNPSCSGCHSMMDDIGLGLENFDALGAYRETENGITIDATSTIGDLGTFTGAKELGALLKTDKRVMTCLTRSLFRAALGHVETMGEEQPVRDATKAFEDSGYRLKDVMVAVATSDSFRYAAPEVSP
ncbi:MAG: DUF1592 domain-containing protein [Myxococcaceae bacterium]